MMWKDIANLVQFCTIGLTLVCVGCSKLGVTTSKIQNEEPVEKRESEVVAILDAMPSWTVMDATSPEARSKIKKACEKIQTQYPLSVIREAVKVIMRRADAESDIETASKVFVLNRFLFCVPEGADASKMRCFGGWANVPVKDGCVDMLWPWGHESGELELKNEFSDYFGEFYNGVGEFDYFGSHYKVRTTKQESNEVKK